MHDRARFLGISVVMLLLVTVGPRPSQAQVCTGDCDGNGTVDRSEWSTCVDIWNGLQSLGACPPCDGDADGVVTEEEVAVAKYNYTHGCSPAGTATPCSEGTCTPVPTALPTDTPPPTASWTPPPTATPTPLPPSPTWTPTMTPRPTRTPIPCVGDCNEDNRVTQPEIQVCWDVSLGIRTIGDCLACDDNGDGAATIDEIILAKQNAATGCPGGPPPDALIQVGFTSGAPGEVVPLTVTVHAANAAAVQNDIDLNPSWTTARASIAPRTDGRPDCTVNPAINKNATHFQYLPAGCHPLIDCTAMRAVVFATDNVALIPDGALLYTCSLDIGGTTVGTYPLPCGIGASASSPSGDAIITGCGDGMLVVLTTACIGDCDGSGSVTVDDLVTGVNIALGLRPLSDCSSFDVDGSGTITVEELILGVNSALRGCT